MQITPTSRLLVADEREAFGYVQSLPECISWDLRSYLAYGKNGGQFSGFTLDPNGQYAVQTDQVVPFDADASHWTGLTGATYSYGTEASGPFAGKKFLYGVAASGTAFAGTSAYSRYEEEGLTCLLYRSAVASGVTSDFYLLFQPGYSGGGPQYRLAFVPGAPIRLQLLGNDGVTWADAATANETGECTSYLESVGGYVRVDVLPMTDPTWAAGLPQSAGLSGPPPNLLVVSLNGSDAILTVPTATFPGGTPGTGAGGGFLGFSGHSGQFSLRLGLKRFTPTASAAVPEQVRARDFQTTPVGRVQGYIPYGATLTPTITQTGSNKAAASLSLDASAYVDATGLSLRTVFLSTLDADFPALQVAPSPAPAWDNYAPVQTEVSLAWDQKSGTLRSSATTTLTSNNDEFAPGSNSSIGAQIGVRAGQIQLGYPDYEPNGDYPGSAYFQCGVQPVLTGPTGIDGFSWAWVTKQKYFRLQVSDRLRRGDPDQICCGYCLPDDGQNHFYALRIKLQKIGITDDWLNFPLRERDDNQPTEYFLPRGTTKDPVLLPHPSTPVNAHLDTIRRLSGVYDSASGQILPMALGVGPAGEVDYFGLPVGVVNLIQSPASVLASLTPAITFGGSPQTWPDGSPVLNEILDSGLETAASLANIRTDIVLEGLDPSSGGAVVGIAKDGQLAGPDADPMAPGYVNVPVPFYDIDRLYASAEVAEVAAQLAAIQLQFPAIQVRLKTFLHPWLLPLTIFAVDDYGTTGSLSPVLFYVTEIRHVHDGLSDPQKPTGFSYIVGRLLGQL